MKVAPNNAFHSDGPRFARPAGERERWAASCLMDREGQGDLVHASRQARREGAGANTHDRPGDARAGFHAITETNDLRLVIEPAPCTDVMSGHLFETTVTVSLNNQTYHGCGGPLK